MGQRSKVDGVFKSKTGIWNRWYLMLGRCYEPYSTGYQNYGARGIRVCEQWHTFENFLADMGQPPASGFSLDRIDNDGDYEPGNCRWTTRVIQNRNRRFCRQFTHEGRTQLLTDWAKELGVNLSTISMRIDAYGWPIAKALTTKVRSKL